MSPADLALLDGDSLWSVMRAAASGSRDGLAAVVARQCLSGASPRLGWVCPPPWSTVERSVAAVLAACRLPAASGLLPLATGGWSFAARAICETVSQAAPAGLTPALDSLEPAMIRRALRHGDRAPGAFLAISASGGTLETRLLARVVSERGDTACTQGGRRSAPPQAPAGRAPVVWLRDETAPPDVFALSPCRVPDQVAMLGAPLSTAFLVAAAAADAAGLADAYSRLLRRHDRIGAAAARQAAGVRVHGSVLVHLVAPEWAGPGLRLWLLQLARQVVCGKSARFRPRIEVVAPDDQGATPDVRVDLGTSPRSLPGLVETMYYAGIFVGSLALRAGVAVAEHAHVAAYKDRLADARQGIGDLGTAGAGDLPDVAHGWLASQPELTRLHVVLYDSTAMGPGTGAGRFAAATGRSCEVHAGSAWNHHSFHAVYADRSVGVLLAVASPEASAQEPAPLLEAARTLRQTAIATHLALADRSIIVQLPAPAMREGD